MTAVYQNATPMMQKMIKARVNLMLSNPFFGQLSLKLRLIETKDIPTCGVNSREMLFNPDFIAGLSSPQVKGLVAHEVMHLVFMHHLRRGNRDPGKWNSAGDYAINPILTNSGFSLPPDGLDDPKFHDMSADKIYNLLPDQPSGGKKWQVGFGEVLDDGKGKTEAELGHMEAEMKISIAEAAQAAKMAGKLPGALEQFVGELLEAQVDWREKLRTFINRVSRNDYDWSRPSRRYEDVYWPRLYSEEAGKIAVAIDTSGSVSNRELEHFFSELNAIVDEVRPAEIDILDIDSRIHQIRTFTSDEYPINWREMGIKGRGGTAFSPAFEHYEKALEQPECLIYLTDLCCSDFGNEPQFPVLWVSTTNHKDVPFGEVTRIHISND